MANRIRNLGVAVLFLSSVGLLIWGYWPQSLTSRLTIVEVDNSSFSGQNLRNGNLSLFLEWSQTVNVGDGGIVRLSIAMDPADDIWQNEHVNYVVITRMDLTGTAVLPPDVAEQALAPGKNTSFYWSYEAGEEIHYLGEVWVYLRIIGTDGNPVSERAIAVLPFETITKAFLGLKASHIRAAGVIGLFLCPLLGFHILEIFSRWVWVRVRELSGKK
ncbi:MAG: hypothetical protein ABIJ39_07975 [Chloroflexota bacterium]